MGREIEKLTAMGVARMKKPGYHGDGGGLYLQVSQAGTKSWIFRYKFGGREREMGLGALITFSLAEARQRAQNARQQLADKKDPIEERDAAARSAKANVNSSITFESAAQKYIAAHKSGWKNAKHAQQWASTLRDYAEPVMGAMMVRDITLKHVLQVLEPIWNTKTETASRVRNRIELVLDWAKTRGYRDGDNPARWREHLDKLLPKPSKVTKVVNHPALPIDAMGDFMVKLRGAEGLGAKALEFTVLTAARSGEVRGATWDEIDLTGKVWTVPAERMKAGKEHRVPLSNAAIALLNNLPRSDDNNFVFPSATGIPLSDMTLTAVCRRLQVPAVPHGFRSTFRDWASERTEYPHEMCEMALAHTIGNKAEAAYRRGDMFLKRGKMMNDWADFIAKPAPNAKVVPIKKASAVA